MIEWINEWMTEWLNEWMNEQLCDNNHDECMDDCWMLNCKTISNRKETVLWQDAK